jgi:tetratricopeptide (TPR) repeat protein
VLIRCSSSVQRAAILVTAVFVAIPIAYYAVISSLAVRAREERTLTGYERATRLTPTDPANWQLLGNYWQYEARIPEFGLAIRAYREGLALNPHSYEMWVDIAMAYEAENRIAEAKDAFAVAERAYPVSPDVAWRYGNFLIRQNELPAGLKKLYQSVSFDPARAGEAFHIGSKVLPDADINYLVHTVIPPSTVGYVAVLEDLTAKGQFDNGMVVWGLINEMGPDLPLHTVAQFVNSLKQAGRPRDARRVWDQASALAHLNLPQSLPGSLIWDGSFESGFNNFGYAWYYQNGLNGVQIFADTKEKRSGSVSLRVTFDGSTDLTFRDVCQRIPVTGLTSYKFSAWIRMDGLTTDQGIRFGMAALNVNHNNETVTGEFHGTLPWTRVTTQWTAPGEAQEMEICLLRFPSDQSDNKIRGTVWIDDVTLVPESWTYNLK